MKDVQTVTVWGDSVMKGVIFDEEKGRYTLLPECGAEKVSKKLGVQLRNRSRMGCTVTKGLDIMKKDLLRPLESEVALIEFGGNDCDYNWTEIADCPDGIHLPKTPIALFEKELTDMIQMVRGKGMTPIVLTLPPIHAKRYFNFFTRNGLNQDNILRWLGEDIEYIYRWHERYNAAVVRVAKKCDCILADVREAFLVQRHYEEWLCIDGIHPNERGHAAIERTLEDIGVYLHKENVAV